MVWKKSENYLLISDLQMPFEHRKALEFCKQLQKEFKIKPENVYNVGDEVDLYWMSDYDKDVEADHTANQEWDEVISKLYFWYKAFPRMKLCNSNHLYRYMKKFSNAQIPKRLIKDYKEVIEAPRGWVWQDSWLVKAKHPFWVIHGDDFGGQHPHIQAAMHYGASVFMGHHHAKACVRHIKTKGLDLMCGVVGSLIDFDRYAFNYARKAKLYPQIGATIVLDGGKSAIFIPLK